MTDTVSARSRNPLAFLDRTDVTGRDAEEAIARRPGHQRGIQTQLVRSRSCESTVEPHRLACIAVGVQHRSGQKQRTDRKQPEIETGDDAEIAAAAAQSPEQVRVLILAADELLPRRGHEIEHHRVAGGLRDVDAQIAPDLR